MRPTSGLLPALLCSLGQAPASRPVDPAEVEAAAALAALEEGLRASKTASLPSSLPATLALWGESARKAYLDFAARRPGTEAAARARLRAGTLLGQVEGKLEEAIALLDALAADLRGVAGREPLLSEAALTAGLLLRDGAQADRARAHLEEVVALRASEAAARAAQGALARLEAAARVRVGETAPAFEARTSDGREVSSASYRGRVLLLDFWSAAAPSWREGLPFRRAALEALGEKGLDLLGISLDPADRFEGSEFADLLRAEKVGWPQVFDGAGPRTPLARTFAVERVPASFLLDRKGRIRFRDLRGEDLRSRVEALLAEASDG